MNIRQLRAVRAIIVDGTVTNAASRLGLTQSAVSRLLLQLEAEVGFRLFHRHQGRLWVTPEGEAFSLEAKRVLSYLDHLIELASDITRLQVGFMRIVAMPTMAYGVLPQAIASFSKSHSNVEIEVRVRQRKDLENLLESEPFDVAFAAMPFANDMINVSPLIEVQARCIVPLVHRLAGNSHVQLSDCGGETFIAGAKGTLLRNRLDEIFASAGIRLRRIITAETTMMACELVAAGIGVSVIHPFVAAGYSDRISIRKFGHDLRLRYGTILPAHRPRSKLTDAFIDIVRMRCEEMSSSVGSATGHGGGQAS